MSGGKTFRGFQRRAGVPRRGFTLIELLVVISIVVMLMALLLPSLSRARKQARAVVCQNTCRQWGIMFTVYAAEHDGHLMFTPYIWHMGPEIYIYSDELGKASFLCPEAGKNNAGPAPDVRPARTRRDGGSGRGGKFTAWWNYLYDDGSPPLLRLFSCSYGTNGWIGDPTPEKHYATGVSEAEADAFRAYAQKRWTRATLRSPSQIPVLFDCALTGATPWDTDEPPAYEEDFTTVSGSSDYWEPIHNTTRFACFDRHGRGTVNVAFLDGSARKVGLKELWTLKWYTQCSTRGPWTRAGGALPEDWPEWMRQFKDY